jgi:hypothetical protein
MQQQIFCYAAQNYASTLNCCEEQGKWLYCRRTCQRKARSQKLIFLRVGKKSDLKLCHLKSRKQQKLEIERKNGEIRCIKTKKDEKSPCHRPKKKQKKKAQIYKRHTVTTPTSN